MAQIPRYAGKQAAKLKILLVDDNVELREIHAALLVEDLGAEVIEATTWAEAKRWIDTTKFNIIFLDNNLTADMELQEGLQLAEHRLNTRNATTPTFIVTGYNAQADFADRAKEAGVVTLEKGYNSLTAAIIDIAQKMDMQRA